MHTHMPKTIIAKGKFLQLAKDGKWEYAERINASGVVAIIAMTVDHEIVLTEQHRVPVGARVIDLPAGLAGDIPGEEAEALVQAAQRELLEETGYSSKVWKPVYRAPSSPGLSSEIVDYFLANNARRVADGGGVEDEGITVHAIPLRTIRRWLRTKMAEGIMVDPKVYVALAFLQ